MENSVGNGIQKKYAAVRVGGLKSVPVFVSLIGLTLLLQIEFIEDNKSHEFFLQISGKNLDLSLSFDSIQFFGENKE